MAIHSVTTIAAQEAALRAYTDRLNGRRVAAAPPKPALSATEVLQARVGEVLDSYVRQEQRRSARAKLTTADIAALGLGSEDGE